MEHDKKSLNDLPSVTIAFPTEIHRDDFMAWFSDGGGEYSYISQNIEVEEIENPIVQFDYSKAFPAWGYDPEKDGEPVIVAKTES